MAELTARQLAALEFAKGLIARREHSVFELRRKLQRKGLTDEADAVIDSLAGSGLLDDERFAHAWVAVRIGRKGSGRRRLVAELIRRGVSRSVAEPVVDAELPEAEELALLRRGAAALKASGYQAAAIRRRLLAQGFPPAAVRRIADQHSGCDDGAVE